MTAPSQHPQPEYIITCDMLATWRSGCIQWRDKNPDAKCYGCEYDNKKRGGCDFDDDEMQKIFQSHPHTPARNDSDVLKKLQKLVDAFYEYAVDDEDVKILRDGERAIEQLRTHDPEASVK